MIVALGAISRTSAASFPISLGRATPTFQPSATASRSRAPARPGRRPTRDRRLAVRRVHRVVQRLTRSLIVPNSSPNASFSARLSESPAPIPAISRPLLTRCAVSEPVRQRRGRLQRCAGDQRARRGCACLRRHRAEQREALERGPALGRVPVPEVVEHEHRVEARRLGRGVTAIGISGSSTNDGSVRPTRTLTGQLTRASTAVPMAPACSPSRAGTIGISGRYVAPSTCAHERLVQRIEQQRPELHEAACRSRSAPGRARWRGRPAQRHVVGVARRRAAPRRRRRPPAPPAPRARRLPASAIVRRPRPRMFAPPPCETGSPATHARAQSPRHWPSSARTPRMRRTAPRARRSCARSRRRSRAHRGRASRRAASPRPAPVPSVSNTYSYQ